MIWPEELCSFSVREEPSMKKKQREDDRSWKEPGVEQGKVEGCIDLKSRSGREPHFVRHVEFTKV